MIDVTEVESAQFGDAETGTVEQLEHGIVTTAHRRVVGGGGAWLVEDDLEIRC